VRVGQTCGYITAADNCGSSRSVNCGTCDGAALTGAGGGP
jgi:hypothetical protein